VRLVILSPGYPANSDPYNWAFVHARAKLYRMAGHEVLAAVPGPKKSWVFEGVEARQLHLDELGQEVLAWGPDVMAVHGAYRKVIAATQSLPIPRVVWVHGHEALWEWGAFLRGATARARLALVIKTPLRLLAQQVRVRRFLRASRFVVFVSAWMRSAAERHTAARYPHAVIMPNPVDTELFRYG